MTVLTAGQIRAARALMNWSQKDMAKATNLSIATIRKLELGYISPRPTTTAQISGAIEEAGLEFIDPEGVRRRHDGIHVFEGVKDNNAFLDDMMQTIKNDGGEVLIVTPTADVFARICGLEKITALDCLVDLNLTAEIKCLFTNEYDPPLSTPRFQFRSISRNYVDPTPFCVYGRKYGTLIPLGDLYPKIIVLDAASMAEASRRYFFSLWEKTMPMMAAENGKQATKV
jgi:transcriptional regulator with XRE-family HTH domain